MDSLGRREMLRDGLRGVVAFSLLGLGVWLRRASREPDRIRCSAGRSCAGCPFYREGCREANIRPEGGKFGSRGGRTDG